MLAYIGNGPYCYANSAAMLLKSLRGGWPRAVGWHKTPHV